MEKKICLFLCLLSFSFVKCQSGLLLPNIADSINDLLRSKREVDNKGPSCPTVNNLPARCVDLASECPILHEAAENNKNNPKFTNTIKQLQCGSKDDKNPLVCCPVDWIPKAPTERIKPPPRQPAVTKPLVTNPPVTNPPVTNPPVTKPPVPEETCKSLNSGHLPGRCVSLVECPSLYKQAMERSKDPAVRNKMYRIHCGWVKNDSQTPQICCPLENIATPAPVRPSEDLPQGDAPTQEAGDLVDDLPNPPVCGADRLYIPRVVGGRNARRGMFPWMALLGYRRRSDIEWRCGGSLISTRHILTAAHCIHGNEKKLFQARLGELDLAQDDDDAIDVPIKKMVIHEEFVPEINENDIGMLTLATEVQYTNLIKPICMPMKPELRSNSFEDYTPFLAGWGQIKYAGKSASRLQFIQLPVTNTAECNEIYKREDETFKTLDNRSLCAGYKQGKMDSCSGDSGGPLMQPDIDPEVKKSFVYQTGIISFGKGCGAPGFPGIYVRVTEYIPWIVKQTTGKIVS